jgi:hypothetical protein
MFLTNIMRIILFFSLFLLLLPWPSFYQLKGECPVTSHMDDEVVPCLGRLRSAIVARVAVSCQLCSLSGQSFKPSPDKAR